MKKIVLTLLLSIMTFSASFSQENMKELYKKADNYNEKYSSKLYGGYIHTSWIDETDSFFYSEKTPKGTEYFLVNALKKTKKPAFNQEKLAKALSKKCGEDINPYKLEIKSLTFNKKLSSINFKFKGEWLKCNLKKYSLSEGVAEVRKSEYPEGRWDFPMENNPAPVASPDGTKEAYISEGDIFVRNIETQETTRLSQDGSLNEYYSSKIYWSPDSKKLVSSLYRPVKERQITLVESSPEDQLEPKYYTFDYAKPGDALPVVKPVLFNLEQGKKYNIEFAPADKRFYTDWDDNKIEWRSDSSSFTFDYNKRGHSEYIVYKVDANNGECMPLIDEKSDTFIDYRRISCTVLEDSNEVLWFSSRDGWHHLYLIDYKTGKVKRQLTKGEWYVRSIIHVDEKNRNVIVKGMGYDKGHDPYYGKYYVVNLDNGNITPLTPENGTHWAKFSADYKYMVDIYSRVDFAPIAVLRDATNGNILMELSKTDISEMLKEGYRMPEPFVAKGRDGKTDIYGIIMRPTDFDPNKTYPVIEYIYAGPHNSFVPKSFDVQENAALCELGFIVVQIDGMGTNNRSKAFHDITWKNLKDSGFPDRIAWLKTAAKKYPEMDISNMAIFGFSSGGQSSLGALLFFNDFYKVAVASCGCYDNRMDKIWWNEQWMGEVGPHYDDNSMRVHAKNLKGKLMLMLGEIDDNVDPSSTLQVIDQLIKHDKEFDFVILPGVAHTNGEKYGERKRRDFFVRNLLHQESPNWN